MKVELIPVFVYEFFNSRGGTVMALHNTKEEADAAVRNYFYQGLTEEEADLSDYYVGQVNLLVANSIVKFVKNGKDLGNAGNGGVRFYVQRPDADMGLRKGEFVLAFPGNLDAPEGWTEVRLDDDAFICLILK